MSILSKGLEALNRVIPKKNIIVFNSFPDFSDNSYELYKYIVGNRSDLLKEYKLVWTKMGSVNLEKIDLHPDTVILEKKSLRGIWAFLRAKYVITTHGYFQQVRSGKNQLQISLWHGCGYKSIPPAERGYRGDTTIVTSSAYSQKFCEYFCVDAEHVKITGYPRNDRLFHAQDTLSKLGIDKRKYSRIAIWMPTYRKAGFGHDEVDGLVDSLLASNFSKEECDQLNDRLRECNILLIIKPHPMDSATLEKFKELSNICCYTTQELQQFNVGLYDLLAETDLLLSDYSSVVVDYLLTDKPIVMVLSDIKEYQESRGFVFEHIEEYFPGPIISKFDELLEYFKNMEQINHEWEQKRIQVKTYLHKYWDDNSSERIVDMIWGRGK